MTRQPCHLTQLSVKLVAMTEGTQTSIQGARAGPRLGGRKPQIDGARATEMYEEEGMSQKEIGEYFGTSQAAVSAALKKFKKEGKNPDNAGGMLPWRVLREHQRGSNQLYRLMVAFQKWNRGLAVNEKELSDAKALQNAASKLGMAITYDRDRGFLWTDRRPGEENEMFVVRD